MYIFSKYGHQIINVASEALCRNFPEELEGSKSGNDNFHRQNLSYSTNSQESPAQLVHGEGNPESESGRKGPLKSISCLWLLSLSLVTIY